MNSPTETILRLVQSLQPIRQTLDSGPVLDLALAIQQIPAPTFDESRRAAHLHEQFARRGLVDLRLDELHNVFGRRPGTDPGRSAVMISAHTDTVFSAGTDLSTRRQEGRMWGPGLGDNSLGDAALLALIDLLNRHDLRTAADLWFVANSREEGLGDLGGIRAAYMALRERVGTAIVLEGMALGQVYHAGIGVRRLRIACKAPGGHSWLHFGQPSAVHGLIELGSRILALTPPDKPRTTYNIGLIRGGQTVNSLAADAELTLDLRSEDVSQLAVLETDVRTAVDQVGRPGLDFTIDVVGDRPAGRIEADHPLVQLAGAALEAAGHTPAFDSGSTDANLLLARGLPTVTIGITTGGHAHRLDEYIDTGPIVDGLWQLLLLVMAVSA